MLILALCKHTASFRGILSSAYPFCMHAVKISLFHALGLEVCTCGMSFILGKVLVSLFSCMQNLQLVISHLLTLSNTTEQRDGRRDTALMLARKRGLEQVVDMLLTAGATDLPGSYATAGCRAWAPGIYDFQTSIYRTPCPSVCLSSTGCWGHRACCKCKNKARSNRRFGNTAQCSETKLACIKDLVWVCSRMFSPLVSAGQNLMETSSGSQTSCSKSLLWAMASLAWRPVTCRSSVLHAGQSMPYNSRGQTASSNSTQIKCTGAPHGVSHAVQRPPGLFNVVQRPPGLHDVNGHASDKWERPPGFGSST